MEQTCREAVKARRTARKLLERRPSSANLKSYLEQNNIAATVIKKSKCKAWEDYISTLTPEVPIKEIWNKIKAIKNSYMPRVYPLMENNISITDPKVKANIFVKYFKQIGNLNKIHVPRSMELEIERSCTDRHHMEINKSNVISELNSAIKSLKMKSPGSDMI